MSNLFAAAIFAVGMGGWFSADQEGAGAERAARACSDNQVAGSAPGGAFELVNGDGETVTQDDVITGPTLVYFGYTFCPDICPTDMARNAVVVNLLKDKGIEVEQLFVSVDPERDTPDIAAGFARSFSPTAIGLSGSVEQVEAAKKAFRVFSRKQDTDPDYYLVDHSTHSYLVDENGFIDFFRHGSSAQHIADISACWLED